jgi:RNA polymerase sigma-70 factor (ECF subfamily)
LEPDKLKETIASIQKDDEKAFHRLFDAYYPRFLQLACHITRSEVLAEEVVSDVFVKIWNNRQQLGRIENLPAYFYTAIRNQSLSYHAKKGDSHEQLTTSDQNAEADPETPEAILLDQELSALIQSVVANLPARCRIIFQMVKEDRLTYKQVAELLQISPKTVQAQMVIALQRIKKAWQIYSSH